jgi:hypothetical protein
MCPVVSDLSATVSRAKSGERFPTLLTPLTVGALTFKNRVFVTGHMTMMVSPLRSRSPITKPGLKAAWH